MQEAQPSDVAAFGLKSDLMVVNQLIVFVQSRGFYAGDSVNRIFLKLTFLLRNTEWWRDCHLERKFSMASESMSGAYYSHWYQSPARKRMLVFEIPAGR